MMTLPEPYTLPLQDLLLLCNRLMLFLWMLSYIFGCYLLWVFEFEEAWILFQFVDFVYGCQVNGGISLCYQFVYLIGELVAISLVTWCY